MVNYALPPPQGGYTTQTPTAPQMNGYFTPPVHQISPQQQQQMQQALVARQSYRAALKDCPPGPLRDRFTDMEERVDDVVDGLYKLVVRAQGLRQYLQRTPARMKEEELARTRSTIRAMTDGPARQQMETQADALSEQLAARQRIQVSYDGAMAKIGATVARLEQMSAQVAEVGLLGDDAAMAGIPGTVDDVSQLVEEVDDVREALEDIASPAAAPRRAQAQPE